MGTASTPPGGGFNPARKPTPTLHCVVCGLGSNRDDWQNTRESSKLGQVVACDWHSPQEIDAAVRGQEAVVPNQAGLVTNQTRASSPPVGVPTTAPNAQAQGGADLTRAGGNPAPSNPNYARQAGGPDATVDRNAAAASPAGDRTVGGTPGVGTETGTPSGPTGGGGASQAGTGQETRSPLRGTSNLGSPDANRQTAPQNPPSTPGGPTSAPSSTNNAPSGESNNKDPNQKP